MHFFFSSGLIVAIKRLTLGSPREMKRQSPAPFALHWNLVRPFLKQLELLMQFPLPPSHFPLEGRRATHGSG